MGKRIGHTIVFGLELVCIDDTRWFFVDRVREELRSIDVPGERFMLAQRQFGRREDGDVEILERYQTEDGSDSLVLDASPAWLAEIRDFEQGMLSYGSIA